MDVYEARDLTNLILYVTALSVIGGAVITGILVWLEDVFGQED